MDKALYDGVITAPRLQILSICHKFLDPPKTVGTVGYHTDFVFSETTAVDEIQYYGDVTMLSLLWIILCNYLTR